MKPVNSVQILAALVTAATAFAGTVIDGHSEQGHSEQGRQVQTTSLQRGEMLANALGAPAYAFDFDEGVEIGCLTAVAFPLPEGEAIWLLEPAFGMPAGSMIISIPDGDWMMEGSSITCRVGYWACCKCCEIGPEGSSHFTPCSKCYRDGTTDLGCIHGGEGAESCTITPRECGMMQGVE